MFQISKSCFRFCFKSIISFFFVTFLIGCESIRIVTSSTTFHGPQHELRGQLSILPIDSSQKGSLEFDAVSEHLYKKFEAVGYKSARGDPNAEYVVFVTYGIDNGKTTSTSVPIFGQTGGGTSFTSGTVTTAGGVGTYSGMTTTMPTYGMVGAIPVQTTVFKRVVNIDVYRKTQTSEPTKAYEIRATSVGSCGDMNMVLFKIIDGIFMNFPGKTGDTKVVEVPHDKEC